MTRLVLSLLALADRVAARTAHLAAIEDDMAVGDRPSALTTRTSRRAAQDQGGTGRPDRAESRPEVPLRAEYGHIQPNDVQP